MGDKENKLLIQEIIDAHKVGYVKVLRAHYPDLVKWIRERTEFLNSNGYRYNTKIYCVLNDINDIHKCKICGKEIKNVVDVKTGYHKYCSCKCRSNDIDVQNKIKQTNLDRYGVEHTGQVKEIRDKMKHTMVEKYGVEYPGQSKEFREKANQVIFEKYGVKCSLQNKEVREKSKQTMLERYGVENASQNLKIQEKTKRTNLERYGFEFATQNDEIKKKIIKSRYLKKEVDC